MSTGMDIAIPSWFRNLNVTFSEEQHMYPSHSEFYQDEAWRKLAADINEFVGVLVDQGGTHRPLRDLRQRLVSMQLGNLKLRLAKQKQSLQSYLGSVEEQLLINSGDEEARGILALGAERLADMWLMEGLLQRLGKAQVNKAPVPIGIPHELSSTRSSEAV